MVWKLEDTNLNLSEKNGLLFIKNLNKIFDMENNELIELLKYIFCEYSETLYSIENLELGFNQRKLYCDIYNVFKNEDYIDILEYNLNWKSASIVLYDVGWCGVDGFYKKVDKYVQKFKDLSYNVEYCKYYDESEFGEGIDNYCDIIFRF